MSGIRQRFFPTFSLAAMLLVAGFTWPAGGALAKEAAICQAGAQFSVPPQRIANLARGFNLTGWLVGPTNRQRPDPEVLAGLHARGFTHVRLPLSAERFMRAFTRRDEVAGELEELDRAIDTLMGIGFAVSLDLHPGDALGSIQKNDPARAFDLIDRLWGELAKRYARRPADRLFFEVLNEPGFDAEIWAEMGPRLVETIRREAPDHTIVYALSGYQRIEELAANAPLAPPNIVYAVHFYDPMIFTHQALDWDPGPLSALHDVPFPASASDARVRGLVGELRALGRDEAAAMVERGFDAPWDERRIALAMAQAAHWSRANRVPVIVNEFGVLAWKAAPGDRVRWLKAVSQAAAGNCLGWAIWDYAEGFGFVERIGDLEIPDEAVLAGLLGNAPAARRSEGARRSTAQDTP